MHKIDGSGHLNGAFVAEDPFNNQPGTLITEDWLNAVQQEIVNVIDAADLVLNKNDNSQLLQAISNLIISSTSVPRGYIAGLALSTAGASSTMSVASGQAADSTGAVMVSLPAEISKTASLWAFGSGVGGLDAGEIANNTWYHWFLIRRPDTGVVDVTFSLSATAPTLPPGYSQYRRIGSGKTNGAAQWVKFIQTGDEFILDSPVNDANTTNSATAQLLTLSVPSGVKVKALTEVVAFVGPNAISIINLYDPALADPTVSSTTSFTHSVGSGSNVTGTSIAGGEAACFTNTSSQVRVRGNGVGSYSIVTKGWVDNRGKDLT